MASQTALTQIVIGVVDVVSNMENMQITNYQLTGKVKVVVDGHEWEVKITKKPKHVA